MNASPTPDYPLEPSAAEMRRLVDAAMERIVTHIMSLPDQPASNPAGAHELARSLVEPLPERGTSFDELLRIVFDRAVPTSFNTAGPGYLAYIPGGGIFDAAVADLVSDAINRYVGVWLAAPGLVQLEANVLRWFAEMVGYPETARGILTSGGSLANFSALVTARRERLPEDFRRGAIYVSDQAHHSVAKAAMLAGFPAANVRVVPSDHAFRIRLDALARQITDDRREGWEPFLVVVSGGTTNTGAVDDLAGAAALARSERIWLHVDAAYGGFFVLTDAGRAALAGIGEADSIVLDPHKGLFLPYGTGCLLVRDGAALTRAHRLDAAYLPAMQDSDEFPDFCNMSPELSRDFRGLRVWLPLRLRGVEAFRRSLTEKLELARWAADRLSEIPELEVLAPPQLSIVAFAVRRNGRSLDEVNRLTQTVLDRVNARRRVYLTTTTIGGRLLIRICVLSFRTHRDRMEAGLEDVRAAVAALPPDLSVT
ncbi:MAG TPA: aminotransferase class V-fold PLP-dependent enzyme [Gemmatimonadales bacterium]|nr:aminotransferase class V-fold PLP-dependent enzyme [Gemmatimonadales bacterium]